MKSVSNKINGYDLTRDWFDFAFENQGKITGNHGCLYLWLVELNNRMGWVSTFASPASQTMAAVGISSYNTYKKILNDLIEWGFVKMIKPSKNQYTANIIALSKNDKAVYKALDKAMTTHNSSTIQSTDSIIKQVNKETIKQINKGDLYVIDEIEKFGKRHFKKILIELGSDEKHTDDWLKERENKKAAMTGTALKSFISECQKNNFPISEAVKICAEKGWKGFKYEWLKSDFEKEKISGKKENNRLYNLAAAAREVQDELNLNVI